MIGHQHSRARGVSRMVALASLTLAASLASCGDTDDELTADDIETAASDGITDVSDVASSVFDSAEDAVDDLGDEIDDAADDVQDEIDDVASDTTALPGGPFDENPCAAGASGVPSEGDEPAADATAVEVTAVEYSFSGFEEITSTGDYAFTLANDGAQLHEAVIVRIDDDETRPIEELLQEEDASEFTTDIAFAFACPGESSDPVAVDIDEPGRYVAVCFIPVGATSETTAEEFETLGPPHALEGMVTEFEVT